jgi:hypothetical protein
MTSAFSLALGEPKAGFGTPAYGSEPASTPVDQKSSQTGKTDELVQQLVGFGGLFVVVQNWLKLQQWFTRLRSFSPVLTQTNFHSQILIRTTQPIRGPNSKN